MSKIHNTNYQLSHLKRVLAVQTIYLENYKEGMSKKAIYRHHVKDKHFISERTFWRYLNINARREIKLIEKEKNGAAVSEI